MNYFHFETEPYIKEGKTVYKIVNDVERRIRDDDKKRLKAGTSGGYVEHPELLDPEQNIWIYENAIILGNTTMNGKISIKSAIIDNCKIEGQVQIGESKAKEYLEDVLYTYKMVVRLKNCTIDSRDLKGDYSDELEAFSVLKIMDYTYAVDSKFYGCTEIYGRPHIISSEIRSSRIDDYAGVIKSKVMGNSVIEGSSFLNESYVDHCYIKDNSIVQKCKIKRLQTLENNKLIKGEIVEGHSLKAYG